MRSVFIILAALFAVFFLVNVYFRIRIFEHYRVLIDNRVEFNVADMFSDARMASVIHKYPHVQESITQYCLNMRRTMWMASIFVTLVIIFGFVLLQNR